MTRIPFLALACVSAASLALPGLAAAQATAEDSVVGSLSELGTHPPSYDINVRSGPSGENATGTVTYRPAIFPPPFSANAVCLKISGNQATIVATEQVASVVLALKLTVVDSPPGEPDQSASTFSLNPSVVPSCDTALTVAPAGGSVVVTDAQPFPTSKDQCKNGGWRNYGTTFKNQGQCVAFVERGPKP